MCVHRDQCQRADTRGARGSSRRGRFLGFTEFDGSDKTPAYAMEAGVLSVGVQPRQTSDQGRRGRNEGVVPTATDTTPADEPETGVLSEARSRRRRARWGEYFGCPDKTPDFSLP